MKKKQRGKLYRQFASKMEQGERYSDAIKLYADVMCNNDLNRNEFIEGALFLLPAGTYLCDINDKQLHKMRIIAFYLAAEICNS